MSGFQLAQINVGRLRKPIDHPEIADFKGNLDRINALAEASPGFVWRLTGAGNDATDIRPDPADDLFAVNMSVWTDFDALAAFVYRSSHRDFLRRRGEWFEPMHPYMALWWTPSDRRPTVEEGLERLDRLRRLGPTEDAFTFRERFPHPPLRSLT